MDATQHNSVNDEIDLLDLLVTVAENIKLLVLGPLLAGLLALGVSLLWPQTYQSTSMLLVQKPGRELSTSTIATLATSAAVLGPVADSLGQATVQGRVSTQVGKKDGVLTIITTAQQPLAAQQLNQRVLEQLFDLTRPQGDERVRITALLQQEQAAYASHALLERQLADQLASGRMGGSMTQAYVTLLGSNAARTATIESLKVQLQGLSASDLVQPATLPQHPSQPKKALMAVVAALATGFALLLWVFVRQALRNAGANPESAAKLARIRQALGLR